MRVYPVVSVDTCHSYQIHQPFKYRCTQSWCLQEYGRHSKVVIARFPDPASLFYLSAGDCSSIRRNTHD
jgi:hypothetical protein